jgi:hypothetical protein
MLEAGGVKLPPPYDTEVIATWISQFWIGMEFADLLGEKRERAANRAALDAVQKLLETLDAKVKKAVGRGRKK